jgi:hypothetical protein
VDIGCTRTHRSTKSTLIYIYIHIYILIPTFPIWKIWCFCHGIFSTSRISWLYYWQLTKLSNKPLIYVLRMHHYRANLSTNDTSNCNNLKYIKPLAADAYKRQKDKQTFITRKKQHQHTWTCLHFNNSTIHNISLISNVKYTPTVCTNTKNSFCLMLAYNIS